MAVFGLLSFSLVHGVFFLGGGWEITQSDTLDLLKPFAYKKNCTVRSIDDDVISKNWTKMYTNVAKDCGLYRIWTRTP
jgi:hypothetical protein